MNCLVAPSSLIISNTSSSRVEVEIVGHPDNLRECTYHPTVTGPAENLTEAICEAKTSMCILKGLEPVQEYSLTVRACYLTEEGVELCSKLSDRLTFWSSSISKTFANPNRFSSGGLTIRLIL